MDIAQDRFTYGVIGYCLKRHTGKWEKVSSVKGIDYLILHWKSLSHKNPFLLISPDKKVIVWTVDKMALLRALHLEKISGIITNYPVKMKNYLNSMSN